MRFDMGRMPSRLTRKSGSTTTRCDWATMMDGSAGTAHTARRTSAQVRALTRNPLPAARAVGITRNPLTGNPLTGNPLTGDPPQREFLRKRAFVSIGTFSRVQVEKVLATGWRGAESQIKTVELDPPAAEYFRIQKLRPHTHPRPSAQ